MLTMLKDPPKSAASDPTRLTIQPDDLTIHTGIPTGEQLTGANSCSLAGAWLVNTGFAQGRKAGSCDLC